MRRALSKFAVLACLIASGPVLAQEVSLATSGRPVKLNVMSLPTRDVVDTLSYMSGLPVIVVGTLNGMVENWSVEARGVEAFSALGHDQGLYVAFDGAKVIIAANENVATRIVDNRQEGWSRTRSVVGELFPLLPEGAIKQDQESGMIVLRGPDIVVRAITDLLERPHDQQIQIIRSGRTQVVKPGMQG
ncbi:hypothetical protein ACQ3G6_09715 [Allorhizobium undicola]|uniref:hypothetical protein n=1 Tax=Allorhizobium undicola TaxID=78527 RepID=UPI003D35530D